MESDFNNELKKKQQHWITQKMGPNFYMGYMNQNAQKKTEKKTLVRPKKWGPEVT